MDMSCKETGFQAGGEDISLPALLCLAFVVSFMIFGVVVMFT